MESTATISTETHDFDFAGAEFTQNPYPTYEVMRELDEPLWWPHVERARLGGMWMFPRYEQVNEMMRKGRSMTSDYKHFLPEDEWGLAELMMLNSDKPEHTRLRALAAKEFTPAAVEAFEHRITPLVDDLLDPLLEHGGGDWVEDFARPMPLMVIASVLGVPLEDYQLLGDISRHIIEGIDASVTTEETQKMHDQAHGRLGHYFSELLQAETPIPGGLIASLAEQTGAQLCTHQEALAQLHLIMVAGHVTSIALMSSGLHQLLINPDQMRKLRDDPGLMDSAIEEMLRIEAPLQRSLFRATLVDTEICGFRIPAGQRVSGVIGSANRDPAQFPNPDQFDIARTPNKHLSFGVGFHRCLGEWLIRAEVRIALRRLLERTVHIELLDEDVRFEKANLFRRMLSLQVGFR